MYMILSCLTTASLFGHNVGGIDFQDAARVFVKTVTLLFQRSALFFLQTQDKALVVALSFDLRRQVSLQVRAAIRRVMFLIAFVVTKHVDPIEVRFIHRMRLIRAALLKYQPASGFTFSTRILIVLVFALAIETLPRNKLTTSAIKNDIARHRQFDLLTINPTGRRRRRRRRKSHLVPEFIRFFSFLLLIPLLPGSCTTLLGAAGFGSDVALDSLGGFWLRHTFPTNNVETRSTVESHHYVFVATAIGRKPKIRARPELSSRLRRNILVLVGYLLRLFENVFGHDVTRLNPTFGTGLVARLNPQPSFFSCVVTRIRNVGRFEYVDRVAAINL